MSCVGCEHARKLSASVKQGHGSNVADKRRRMRASELAKASVSEKGHWVPPPGKSSRTGMAWEVRPAPLLRGSRLSGLLVPLGYLRVPHIGWRYSHQLKAEGIRF